MAFMSLSYSEFNAETGITTHGSSPVASIGTATAVERFFRQQERRIIVSIWQKYTATNPLYSNPRFECFCHLLSYSNTISLFPISHMEGQNAGRRPHEFQRELCW
jgi:hypothetical protein